MILQSDNVLDFKNVFKKYGKTNSSTRQLLKDELAFLVSRTKSKQLRSNEFWVLNDISFKLNKGEVLGIIGLNGSGKSTLLKMINGLVLPDLGSFSICGEAGGFIELGAGFQPNLSGRENIYLKCSLMGFNIDQINEMYQGIIDFSELGDFIDTPFKNYSSGMKARLGFAITLNIKPDILLLDEILAVGDYKFKAKCMSELNQLRGSMSALLVSHSMLNISQYCDRAIVLDKGKIIHDGSTKTAISIYYELDAQYNEKKLTSKTNKILFGDSFNNRDKIKNMDAYFSNKDETKMNRIDSSEGINVIINFELLEKANELEIGVGIYKADGTYVSGLNTLADSLKIMPYENNKYKVMLNIGKNLLQSGVYHAVVVVADRGEALYRSVINDSLNIIKNKLSYGCVELDHDWTIISKKQ